MLLSLRTVNLFFTQLTQFTYTGCSKNANSHCS